MTIRCHAFFEQVAVVTACSLALSPCVPIGAQSAASPTAPKTATAAPDGGWPRSYTTPTGAHLLVYQPQIAAWTNQQRMTLYAAVSHSAQGAAAPTLGTLKIEADTRVAVAERLVDFSEFTITESNFPTLEKDKLRTVVAEINASVPRNERVIALDRVLAGVDKSQIIPRNVDGVKADPPKIFFSQTPAVLVNLDGAPIWSPVTGTDLTYAVNTNWDLFEHKPSKTYYLRNNDAWLSAVSIEGPWGPAGKLPDSFGKLPADDNWKDVKAALPGRALMVSQMPAVFVSTLPAELILLRGAPSYLMVDGTNLLWVQNTDSDVFRLGKTGPVYYLVAGRWFSAPGFTGPWTFATPKLPADFQRIPVEHPRSRVLAAVPGTEQAAEAVLLAQVPDRERQQDLESARGHVPGTAGVSADREDHRVARGEHRQGHPQGRRPLLHVLPGRVVHVHRADRPVGGDRIGADADLRDPGELSLVQRDLRHGGAIE